MRLERRVIELAGTGPVSAIIGYPDSAVTADTLAVILGHGAGNDMMQPLLSGVHEELAARGYLTVKFNFPYKERGGRAPDPAPVLEACFRRVVEAIRADPTLRPRRVILGGKSLGGRMASHLAAQGMACDGLLFLGYPLHPTGRPEALRVKHLSRITVPMLFFSGTRDALCDLGLLRQTIATLRVPVTLHVIEGSDHSFALPKRAGRSPGEVIAEIVAASDAWLCGIGTEARR